METSALPNLHGTELPNYRTTDARGHYHACFSDGGNIAVTTGRERWYPKLRGSAPCMTAVYEAIAASLTDEKVIWDVGCGSGVGTHILTGGDRRVLGLDSDPDAVDFARRFSNGSSFERFPFVGKTEAEPDLITLVDVLGMADDPRLLLSQLRQLSSVGTRLVVVESRAFGSQSLCPPTRRAFSKRSLEGLLTRSGWEFDSAVHLSETLVMCTATPELGNVGTIFDAATTAYLRGDATVCRRLLLTLVGHESARVRCQVNLELADLAFQMGDGDAAVGALHRVAEADPSEPGASAGMSRLELALGNAKDALMLAVQALDRDPTDARAAIALANAAELNAPEEAGAAWALASALMPDDVSVLTNRARVCAERGQLDLSIAALEQLRTYHPEPGPDLSITLAWLLLDAGRVADAQLEARVATTLAPDEPEVARLNAAISAALS